MSMTLRACTMLLLALSSADWPQWGGPRRDFTSGATGLATSWPPEGPRRLWSRPLGEGHSAISLLDDRLYTLYRPLLAGGHADEEVVAAIDAKSGATAWEHRFSSPFAGANFGPYVGPHSTPLVTADRVYAGGSRKQLFALDRRTGKVIWSRNLIREYGAPEGDRGYAASPLLWNDLLIVSVGGRQQALAAFNAANGALVWRAGNFQSSPSSPILIEMGGQPQVVYLAGDAVAGFDPATGRVLWSHPHSTSAALNISTPLWSAADRLLFISAGYGTGSRVIELAGGAAAVTERWFNNRIRIHFGNAVRQGRLIIGSSGDFGPMFLSAVDLHTGNVVWQDRSFARAQLVAADSKLLILDEDGHLGLAVASASGLQVLAKARILESIAWTPPTLADTRMFVRDRKTIAAYDLAK
jgi:outer membrane protein assembly factor BamB